MWLGMLGSILGTILLVILTSSKGASNGSRKEEALQVNKGDKQ